MLLFHVKRVAQKERWAVSDLMRMLIVLDATVSWLRLQKQEDVGTFEKMAHVGRVADILSEAVSHKPRTRIYPVVRDDTSQATDVVTLILPAGYARLIETYAATKRISKSDACETLLTFGLIAYSKAENVLLQALQRVREQP
jgi:hypothetical protein